MVYPLTVLCVAGGVSAVLLVFVVPAFQSVFDSLNAELPALTRWLIALSTGVQTYGWLMLLGLLLGAWACRRWLLQQPRIAHAWQGLLLRLPWVGHLVHQACMARWSRTLATLLHAGIPLTEALVAVASVVGNLHYAVATQRVHAQLMQGQSLASSLAQHSPVFQPMLIQLCDIGEASGTLDHMLDKAADHFEDSVNRSVAHLSVLVEPLMMMVLGLLIGCMVLALYLPMFQMGQAL
jgi:type IV pilus assembly protein PilC